MNNTQFKTTGHVEPIYDEDGVVKAYYVGRKELIETVIELRQSGMRYNHTSIERLEKLIEKITY